MRTLLTFLVALGVVIFMLAFVTSGCAQGGGYASAAVQGFAAIKNPVVTVCSAQSSGIPCQPLATIYTDNTLQTAGPNPFTGDVNGNFHFFSQPGWYTVQVCPGSTSQNCFTYLALISADANNMANVNVGTVTSTTPNPAQTGSIKLASVDQICWRNAGNNGDICLNKNTLDQLVGTASSSPLISSTGNPAVTGIVRLAAPDTLCWRNAANSGDICLSKNGGDQIVGAAASTPLISSSTNPAATGQVRLAASDTACWRNAANNGDICLSKNGSDQIIGASATSPFISGSANPAASGILRQATGDATCWRNAGNTADVCITKNGSDQIIGVTGTSKYSIAVAACNAGSAAPALDLPSSGAPTANCTGTNEIYGALSYPAGSTTHAYAHIRLPSTWVGAVDVVFTWYTAATANSTTWQIATGCATSGTTVLTTGPALNTANTVTTADNGTANTATYSSITGITTTGCSAGQEMFLDISRSGTDSNTSAANLLNVGLTLRQLYQ